MPSTKFAVVKADAQRTELTEMWKSHYCHYAQIRAHAVLLSGHGCEIRHLVDIFGVDRDSVSSWIDRYSQGGAKSLEGSDHPGGPRMLDDQEQEVLKRPFKKYST